MKDLIKKIFCISLCVFVMMTYISCGDSEESSAASQDTDTYEEDGMTYPTLREAELVG